MNMRKPTIRILLSCVMLSCFSVASAQDKPNIVLVFMDNFGWGEPGFNGGGIIRGAATPRLDSLAAEGLRLTNFNVEAQCTPMSFMLFSPSVYGKFFVDDGTLTMLGGLSMLSGVIAFVILWGYNMSFQTFLREDKAFIQNGPVQVGKS